MNTGTRIGAFVGLLALLFAGAAFAGAKLDPQVDEPGEEMDMAMDAEITEHGGGHPGGETAELPGLAVANGGYRLNVPRTMITPVPGAELEFSIVDGEGTIVRDFDVEHERRMHLIVVRRDFQGFQHLHPEQLPDGSWSVEMNGALPGVYRMFADFSTAGEPLTLASDLFVAGEFRPVPLAPAASTADAGDGYEVSLSAPVARAGETVETEFVVSRNGRPVDGVEPYLGAAGHLVALREGDQAFLHTHPEGEPGGPGPIRFGVSYPSVGRYRLYLQFRHGGKVRTAEFTRVAGPVPHGGGDDDGH